MAVSPPTPLKPATWAYLLKFTTTHEGPVYHLYNNRTSEDAKQDVTCGIGHLLPSADAAATVKGMFYDPATGQPATAQQMIDDWNAASKILRTGSNLETDYARACKMRMDEDAMVDDMAGVMKSRLQAILAPGKCPELDSFAEMPAQAQVAVASFNYGFLLTSTRNMKEALGEWDFDRAGQESFLRGLSPRKLLAHRTLFWNAARIVEQKLDADRLPLSVDPPELIPWQAWTETVLDLDGGPDAVIRHATEPRRPGTAR
jgi:hypothetical protein